VAARLVQRLGYAFQEGDALHPPENVGKMSAGTLLCDADRSPWLARIAA
jgi:gluconate kinase